MAEMEEVGPPMLNLREGKCCPLRGGAHREALGAPLGALILALWRVLIPGSLSLVSFLPPTEFFGWHFPEYKILENQRLCGQIHLENTA